MTLSESIVEDAGLILPAATLTRPLPWGEVQSRFARTLIPAFSHGERMKRETIRRLNPANACGNPHPSSPTGRGEEAWATIRNYRIVRFERSIA